MPDNIIGISYLQQRGLDDPNAAGQVQCRDLTLLRKLLLLLLE